MGLVFILHSFKPPLQSLLTEIRSGRGNPLHPAYWQTHESKCALYGILQDAHAYLFLQRSRAFVLRFSPYVCVLTHKNWWVFNIKPLSSLCICTSPPLSQRRQASLCCVGKGSSQTLLEMAFDLFLAIYWHHHSYPCKNNQLHIIRFRLIIDVYLCAAILFVLI